MSVLFSPFTLRGVTLPNRIIVSPMCQHSAENGAPNTWHLIHVATLTMFGVRRGARGVPDGQAGRDEGVGDRLD